MVMKIKVLLVEDDHALREALVDTLLLAGHGFHAVASAEEALLAWALAFFIGLFSSEIGRAHV